MGNYDVQLLGDKVIYMKLATRHDMEAIKAVGAQVTEYKKQVTGKAILFIDATQMESSEHPFLIAIKGDANVRASMSNIEGVVVVGMGPIIHMIVSTINLISQFVGGSMVLSATTVEDGWQKLASMRPDLVSILPH